MLVVEGGCDGVASALAASNLGRSVVGRGSGLGGQLASQGVPPEGSLSCPADLSCYETYVLTLLLPIAC